MKNILIVGGSGFLGSKILKRLSVIDSFFIYVYDFNKKNFRYENYNNVKFINTNEVKLESLLERFNFFFIINAAVIYESELKFKVFETNFLMPLKILNYGIKNSCNNFIFFDSFFSKFEFYNKKNDYINSKKYFKNEVSNFDGIKSFNLMLEHLYGPNDNPKKFVEIVRKNIISNNYKMDLSSGNQKRDFIHVDDVCDLVISIIKNIDNLKINNYFFEVGNGESVSIKKFVSTMKSIFKSKIKLNFGGIKENEFEIQDSYANINTISSILKWKPKTNLENGIKSLI